jgi:HSP20 family protein
MNTHELTGHESSGDLSDRAGSPVSTLHPADEPAHPIPCEECAEPNRYVIRFELPGIDPTRDLEVWVDRHVLTVRAERDAETPAARETGFGHWMFRSVVTLPPRTDDRDVAAVYRNGILEVSVGWQGPTARRIRVLHVQDVR